MLGKVIKHEFKATYGTYLLLLLVLLALTVVTKIFGWLPIDNVVWNFIKLALTVVYIIILIFSSFVALIFAVVRFYKTMVKDQGYLTHTMPVKKSQIIWGKLITAVIWQLLTLVMMALSIFIAVIDTKYFEEVIRIINEAARILSENPKYILYLFLAIILLIAGLFASTLMFYAAIGLGQMFQGHKVAGAVIFYIALYYAYNFATMAIIFAIPNSIDVMDKLTIESSTVAVCVALGISILVEIIYAAISYFITYYRFTKTFNIE